MLISDKLDALWVLAEPNQELRRIMIEAMGADNFFRQLNPVIVHEEIDGLGHPRTVLRIKMPDTKAGYVQAVRVVCPTTGRVYHLGVSPQAKTCQEAVAETFGIKPGEYHPDRES